MTPAVGRRASGASDFAVVGAGIVGLVAALLLARRGHRVTVADRRDALWSGTSAVGEGKIHLGPVYALGDTATHELMLRGALSFAPLIESALEHEAPWEALTSEPFEYLVMPTSMVTTDQLAQAYRRMNDMLARSAHGRPKPTYLGRPLDTLIDPTLRRDPVTGLDGFLSRERAIDPASLGSVVADAVRAHPGITTHLGATVVAVDTDTGTITIDGAGGESGTLGPFRAIVNCAWEGRSRLVNGVGRDGIPQNIRVKSAVRLRPWPEADPRAVTLVQGPFGDVVAHRNHTYASWYPIGRVHHESGSHPSPRVAEAVAEGVASRELARAQVDALARIGLLRGDEEIIATSAGVILGDGSRDIDRRDSALHRRARFGTLVHGRLLTPMNYKLTTGPLAAADACEHALALPSA